MKIGELLDVINSAIDGSDQKIDRHTVNYYVQQGFLRPRMTRSKRGFVRRYEFSEEDLRIAESMWRQRLQGVVPRIAYEKVLAEKDQVRLPLT